MQKPLSEMSLSEKVEWVCSPTKSADWIIERFIEEVASINEDGKQITEEMIGPLMVFFVKGIRVSESANLEQIRRLSEVLKEALQ